MPTRLIGREVRIHKPGSEFDNWTGIVVSHDPVQGWVTVVFQSIDTPGDSYFERVPDTDIDVVTMIGKEYREIPYSEWKDL